jgi:hypothetical protein
VAEEIVLHLDHETARDVWSVLYMYGEHYAAGAPVERLPPEAENRLGRFLRDLDVALGGSGRMA